MQRVFVPKKWTPIPGEMYRKLTKLEPILKEKRMKKLPIIMEEELNIYGTDTQRRVLKIKKISNKKTLKKKVVLMPNAANKRIKSEILQFEMKVKMSMSAMKEIDDAGSFDEYILKTPEDKLRTAFAINLKRNMFRKKRMDQIYNEFAKKKN
ncbi:hypothetical protein MHBO_002231 [Bonamia ostreae]|uniref:Ribosomal protein L28 n=1 Tax=Bonamia ostreae TaxID=126728 RepID=A0ABV2AM47_9EUKA